MTRKLLKAVAALALVVAVLAVAVAVGGPVSGAVPLAGVAHAQSQTIYISELTLAGLPVGGGKKEFRAGVAGVDTNGDPVVGALVEGKFYGQCHRKVTYGDALTVLDEPNNRGHAIVVDPKRGGFKRCIQWFEVLDVTKDGYTWDPDLGVGTVVGTYMY